MFQIMYGNRNEPKGRGIRIETPLKNVCLCTRPNGLILCNVCGFVMKGRLRRVCMLHTNTLFLMDVDRCPRCKSYSFMMQEVAG
ncbi:hypothetical protein C0J52_12207 [Blattella germanica]|nr:hypothetical protein C0J52_12207 [Blattella germanica]